MDIVIQYLDIVQVPRTTHLTCSRCPQSTHLLNEVLKTIFIPELAELIIEYTSGFSSTAGHLVCDRCGHCEYYTQSCDRCNHNLVVWFDTELQEHQLRDEQIQCLSCGHVVNLRRDRLREIICLNPTTRRQRFKNCFNGLFPCIFVAVGYSVVIYFCVTVCWKCPITHY